jgi:Adenosine deaminase
VTLSTDDPGIERIDLTHDYARAVTDYALTHADLKDLVRNSIEYSFLLGAGLWADKGGFSRFAADCGGDRPGPASRRRHACPASRRTRKQRTMGAGTAVQAFEAGF